jgi:Xaa-Pro aminopeptidase
MVLLVLCVTLLAPAADPSASPNAGRVSALRKTGALSRPGLLLSKENAYYLFGRALPVTLVGPSGPVLDRLLLPIMGRSPGEAVEKMRTVKDDLEIEKMRRAAAITSKAFEDVAPLIKPGANEAELERAILASYESNGANGIAFRCVVGSGRNATLPHYMDNNADLKDGLVVIDIGCSVDGYASDMTRTFPVNGKLTDAERQLVETVVAAGDAARAMLKPGAKQSELDAAARKVIKDAGFGEYFTHGLGHPVGLDVHDSWIRGPLQAGNVITIEPGIYIPAGSKADKKFWDLGVRVEDSYLLTKDGYEELTHYPKIIGLPAVSEPGAAEPSPEAVAGTAP